MADELYNHNEDFFNQSPLVGATTPKYNQVPLDSGTQGLINDSYSRALTQPYKSSDIDKSASMFMPSGPSQGQQNTGLLSAPGAGQAIANKYAQIAGEHIQGLKTEQGRTDREQEFARTGHAFDNAMKQQQVQTQNYEAYLQQIKNEQMIRAQTMNAIFGTVAKVAGASAGASGPGSTDDNPSDVTVSTRPDYSAEGSGYYGGGSGGGNFGENNGSGNNNSWGGNVA